MRSTGKENEGPYGGRKQDRAETLNKGILVINIRERIWEGCPISGSCIMSRSDLPLRTRYYPGEARWNSRSRC
jgi:hypothetical protein